MLEEPRRLAGTTSRLGALLVVLVVLAYLPVFSAGFILDDDLLLTENPLIAHDVGLRFIWLKGQFDYFPLTQTSLWLEWRLWGNDPIGYHVTNLVLHVIGVCLLWQTLARLKIRGAWLAACLFALHPINVSSVAWVAERKNMLSLPFFVGSVYLFLRAQDEEGQSAFGRDWWPALGSFALGLLAKTSGVMLPFVLLGCVWWRKKTVGRRDLVRVAPFFALALLLGLVTMWFQFNRAMGGAAVRDVGALGRVATAGWAVWFYLKQILLPWKLMVFYPQWHMGSVGVLDLAPAALFIALLAACWRLRRLRQAQGVLFALGCFAVLVLPVLGFIDMSYMHYSPVADHWLHLPIIGPVALAAAALVTGLDRLKDLRRRQVLSGAVGALVLLLGGLTFARARVYADPERLWRDTIAKNPESWAAEDGLGAWLCMRGNLAEGKIHLKRAVTLNPSDSVTMNNYAGALLQEGNREEAIAAFKESIRLGPHNLDPELNIAELYFQNQQFAEAESHYSQVVRIDPLSSRGQRGLAGALLATGKLEEAATHCQLAIKYGGGADAHVVCAAILAEQNKDSEALQHVRIALEQDGDNANVHFAIGTIAARRGAHQQAVMAFTRALELNPNHKEARRHLDALTKQDAKPDAKAGGAKTP